MSCGELLLLTNVTRVPGGTVIVFGDTPLAEIVIVFVDGAGDGAGAGDGDGVVGDELPPQVAAASVAARIRVGNQSVCTRIRRTSWRC